MTSEECQVLLKMCEALREMAECQHETNLSWRALYFALLQHFPDMGTEVLEHRKDADFATELSGRLDKVVQTLEVVIESLKRQAGS